jgi:predicted transcriptional regulator
MADYVLPENLGRRLDELAQHERRSRDEILEEMIAERQAKLDREEAIRLATIRKLYPVAREYWQEVGDETRLALTDEELDQQFWLFDHEGIPRLKADQDKIILPPDPLEELIGIITDADSDLSTSVRKTLQERFNSSDTD